MQVGNTLTFSRTQVLSTLTFSENCVKSYGLQLAVSFGYLVSVWRAISHVLSDCMTSEVSAVCAFGIDVLNNALALIKDVDGTS